MKNEGNGFEKDEILKFASFLGLGFYRVTEEGQFVECDLTARKIFGIPQEETNLSRYSIKELYVIPAERKLRIDRLMEDKLKPLTGTLSVRVNGENKLLFDASRYDEYYKDGGNIVGMVAEIETGTIFPRMFDYFTMGFFEIDDMGRLVYVNQKFLDIFGYKNERDVIGRSISEFYEYEEDIEVFTREIHKKGYAHDILKLKDADNKTLEIECFTQHINPFKKARWGMMVDVTKRERYYRALDRMPTGFFHVENECIMQCNDHFARILGFNRKEDAIGVNPKDLFAYEDERKRYFRKLKEADEKNEPLRNYEYQVKRVDDGKIITVSVDVLPVKDSNGIVIGREGTARDITEKVELEKRVTETQERLEKTTADINKLIHTFLHPVIKFYGNSELLYQVGNILYQTIKPKTPLITDVKVLGKTIMDRLIEIRDNILKNNELDPIIANTLKEKLSIIINVFDYSQQSIESEILLKSAVRDTALWVLEELNKIEYFNNDKLKDLIQEDFIELLKGILFNYFTRCAKILVGETEIMKREVEALRSYIGLKKERKYNFEKHDVGKILEENIDRFIPVLLEENIEIDYKRSGDLTAEISKNDIDRVICSLFHNANKYSYGGKGRFVKVTARELQPENIVEFSIRSYGIPVKKEEIETGNIWKFGYRGEFAYANDRDGTGVGLADAKDTIEAHGGEIFLTSKPVIDDGDPPQYKVPYLTRVIIRIPKLRELKGVKNGK